MSPPLILYQTPYCPYCVMVRRCIDQLGLSVPLRDLYTGEGHDEELFQATGRRTVPVLRIEQTPGEVHWLPESADIVRYLQQLGPPTT